MTAASEGGGTRLLVRDVLLRDGATLRLQAPVPSDFGDIKAFYDGLSLESRYFRFHGYGRTDAVARAEAEASGVDRLHRPIMQQNASAHKDATYASSTGRPAPQTPRCFRPTAW